MLYRITRKVFNDDLIINKNMYMNSIAYFRQCTSNGQGDTNENCVYQGEYKVYCKSKEDSSFHILVDSSNAESRIKISDSVKIFCFTYLDEMAQIRACNDQLYEFLLEWDKIKMFWVDDEEMELLVLLDDVSFINLFGDSARNKGLEACHGLVVYDQEIFAAVPHNMDRIYDEPFLFAFHKSADFVDQREYRFALMASMDNEAYRLDLHGIEEVNALRVTLNKGDSVLLEFSVFAENDAEITVNIKACSITTIRNIENNETNKHDP